jgi:hypothetical protein
MGKFNGNAARKIDTQIVQSFDEVIQENNGAVEVNLGNVVDQDQDQESPKGWDSVEGGAVMSDEERDAITEVESLSVEQIMTRNLANAATATATATANASVIAVRPSTEIPNLADFAQFNSTSDKIRAMAAKGYSRTAIQKSGLKTRNGDPILYQHVRNILLQPARRNKVAGSASTKVAVESGNGNVAELNAHVTKVLEEKVAEGSDLLVTQTTYSV